MTDEVVRQNQARHVQNALESLQQPGDQHFWDVFDELSGLPPSYDVTINQFREGLRSPHAFIQVVSVGNVARFAKDADWVLPELEDVLKREPQDVLLLSATANAIQSLRTPEAAAVLANALDRTLQSDIPLREKGELSTYILRSLVSMGLVAHEQRGVFRRAVDYFANQEDRIWLPDCLWELDMFCVESANDLRDIVSKDPTTLLTDEVLIGYRARTLPVATERVFGDWAILMDEYCKFSSCGLPERFAFLDEACFANDTKGRNLGLARVVVLENTKGMRAVCLCCDEAGVGPVAWYPEVAASMLHRTLKLDPCSTYILTYHLNKPDQGIHGSLTLSENPNYRVTAPIDIFGDSLPDIQRFFFEGRKLPDSTIASAQVVRRSS
jgi:hypothetical protein